MTNIYQPLREAKAEEIDKIICLTQSKIHPDWKGEPEIGMVEKMVIKGIHMMCFMF